MTKRVTTARRTFAASLFVALVMSPGAWGQIVIPIPERFGVIDVTPTGQSGEQDQNSEPSLGIGTGANYGKFIIHAFDQTDVIGGSNYCYATAGASGFALPWNNPQDTYDFDATLNWGAGTCYASLLSSFTQIQVLTSSDPTAGIPFSPIAAATVNGKPDQPWIQVVHVAGVDHILVAFNDLGKAPGATASVRYSLDGGLSWNTTVLDKLTPGLGQDSPAVRLAISPDGQTVYALFQRYNSDAAVGFDLMGDIVLVRDDSGGSGGFGALGNGTLVTNNIVLPGDTFLGEQRLNSACAVAADPSQPTKVYVAYTEVVSFPAIEPIIRVQCSTNGGASFNLLDTITNASIPSLAVAADGTVGLLYILDTNQEDFEVHFLKAPGGDFTSSSERVLAIYPDWDMGFSPYVGDYFTLKAVNFNFFGTFCAWGNPDPESFPSGVFFQRNVLVNGILTNNFWLTKAGTLTDVSGQNQVYPSIDPIFFYDIAASFRFVNIRYRPQWFHDTGDPLSGIDHIVWPELPQNEPQFQLFTSSTLDAAGSWSPTVGTPLITADGQFEAPFVGSQPQAFFRLQQNVGGSQFQVFAAAGGHGSLEPLGPLSVPGTAGVRFTATPNPAYAVSQWYVDGAPAQSGGSTLTLSNIISEHAVVATFVATNDLAVGLANLPLASTTMSSGTNIYRIKILNDGLNPLTGITMTNQLPGTVTVISDTTSQGTINNSPGSISASIGSLAPGAFATVDITFVPLASGSITDTVSVACNQFEADLANNTATNVQTVIDQVAVTNPSSQTVPPGGTATFSVSVFGTPPFVYQWFFNGTNDIVGATSSTLTLTNVSAAQAGLYSVSVFQNVGGPEGTLEADSEAATLTVGSPGTALAVSPRKGQSAHLRRIR